MAKTDANGDTAQPMRVDTALVRELAELLTANELTEIEVEDGGRKIKVKREAAAAPGYAPGPSYAPAPAAAAPAAAATAEPALGEDPAADAVKSPMVGTVFLAGEPGAAPFITEGATVKEGDTLMIIEAMKVMNPILAPAAGTIRRILIGDGQPVEFDQPLVVIA